jgi:hypothetical protein
MKKSSALWSVYFCERELLTSAEARTFNRRLMPSRWISSDRRGWARNGRYGTRYGAKDAAALYLKGLSETCWSFGMFREPLLAFIKQWVTSMTGWLSGPPAR